MPAPTVYTHISIDPDRCSGMPCITGTRIRVLDIASLHNQGLSAAEILQAYEFLTLGQVHAALAYYFDHKSELDGESKRVAEWVEDFRRQHPGLVRRLQ